MAPLLNALREELRRAGDPDRAVQQQAYMKSTLPYYGVRLPEVRQIVRNVLRGHPLSTEHELTSVVQELWDGSTHREEWYAALAILMTPAHRKFRSPRLLPLYEHLIVTGAWWDVVDDIASHAVREQLLMHHDQVGPHVRRWATDKDLWCRRTALVCQVGVKEGTDTKLLAYVIEPNLADPNFFIRKGIGWALRDYSKTDAAWVRRFVEAHRSDLSPLSLKEATQYI